MISSSHLVKSLDEKEVLDLVNALSFRFSSNTRAYKLCRELELELKDAYEMHVMHNISLNDHELYLLDDGQTVQAIKSIRDRLKDQDVSLMDAKTRCDIYLNLR